MTTHNAGGGYLIMENDLHPKPTEKKEGILTEGVHPSENESESRT